MSQLPAALRRPQKNTSLDFGSLIWWILVMEQCNIHCSITRQCWNSAKSTVPTPPETISESMSLLWEFVSPYPPGGAGPGPRPTAAHLQMEVTFSAKAENVADLSAALRRPHGGSVGRLPPRNRTRAPQGRPLGRKLIGYSSPPGKVKSMK